MTAIRALRSDEREAILDLLDVWPLPDGWRGRDFFRRFIEDDPTYADANVWVAAEQDRLVSCAQIFPRPIRTPEGPVLMGGIGSVFTHPERRGAGLATRVMRAVVDDMTDRGFDLGILFATRVSWYQHLGWEPWGAGVVSLHRPGRGAAAPAPVAGSDFDAERDLAAVERLHADYSRALPGTVVRDAALWRTSLSCGGNPEERFLVAGPPGRPVAYVRAILLDGLATLAEWGRTPDALDALLGLVDRVFAEGVPGGEQVDALSLPGMPDAPLRHALEARGHRLEAERPVLEPMLLCLAREALAERLGIDDPAAVARTVLPPERYFFWPADRF